MEEIFKCWLPVDIVKSSKDSERRIIQGIASTSSLDLQGEIVDQAGIDTDYFMKSGYFNYDHKPGVENKVGHPLECKITPQGLWVKGELLKGKKVADDIWEHFTSLAKSNAPRRMGFSIEGRVVRRRNNVIEKCWIQDIAITAAPVNPTTWAEMVKSLTAPQKVQESMTHAQVMECIKSLDPSLDESIVREVADLLTE